MHDPSGGSSLSVKRLAKNVIRSAGYELRRTGEASSPEPDIRQAEVCPSVTYSPWLSDAEFQRIYEGIGAGGRIWIHSF